MDAKTKVRKNIVKLRLAKGWTQEKLAFEAEISKAGLCTIESGKSNPTIVTLEKISNAMGVQIVRFFQ